MAGEFSSGDNQNPTLMVTRVAIAVAAGQVMRFPAVTGIGTVPVVGPALGFVAGALDTFLLKKLIPYSGPGAFINRQYPSLFNK